MAPLLRNAFPVPAGAPDDAAPLAYGAIGARFERTLRLPSNPGAYELRLLAIHNDVIRARRPLQLTTP